MTPSRILVVEDEGIVAKDIAQRLRSLGYEVTGIVPSAEKAYEAVALAIPDLILMDIHLKGAIDGISAAESLRKSHDIPVIFLTAFADIPTLERAKLSEPFGYILKPFEERSLHVHIEMALVKYASEQRLRQREQWITSVLHSVRDVLLVTDLQGKITFMNACAQQLTGWTLSDALGQPIQFVMPFGDKVREGCPTDWVVRNMMPFVSENLELVFGDGRVLYVACTAVPLYDHSHQMVGVTLGMRNVSPQRQLERKVYEDRLQMEAEVKSRTEGLIVENEVLRRSLRSERRQKTMLKKKQEMLQEELARLRLLQDVERKD
jgi:two-component system cell cycle sensor histidine kinase/response regulator CckA